MNMDALFSTSPTLVPFPFLVSVVTPGHIFKLKDLDLRTTLGKGMRMWVCVTSYPIICSSSINFFFGKQFIFMPEMSKQYTRGKVILSINDAGKTGYPHLKNEIRPNLPQKSSSNESKTST